MLIIKMDVKEGVHWIHLALGMVQWWAVANLIMNF
jgi:hypothetical protein